MKTPHFLPLLRLCGAALFATTFAACSSVASSPAATPAATTPSPQPVRAAAPVKSSTLMQRLQSEIGDAACDSDQQCKTMALGHKACGGPESYIPYSTKRGNGAAIVSLGAAYEAERRSQALKGGMMSTCSVPLDPGAACSAGRCVNQAAGSGLAR